MTREERLIERWRKIFATPFPSSETHYVSLDFIELTIECSEFGEFKYTYENGSPVKDIEAYLKGKFQRENDTVTDIYPIWGDDDWEHGFALAIIER